MELNIRETAVAKSRDMLQLFVSQVKGLVHHLLLHRQELLAAFHSGDRSQTLLTLSGVNGAATCVQCASIGGGRICVEKLGGVDICFGGIGINGHLAFNEADGSLTCDEFKQLKTRVLPISPETRAANAIGDFGGRLEDMPVWCVTIGFNEIYNARKIRLGIFRDWHRAVARRCGYGEMTAEFPVSMVAEHPDALIRMTEFVANLED